MRHSEFDRAVADEFGSGGASLVSDLVLTGVDNRTAREALAAGVAPRDVWYALCAETDVPVDRRYGAGRLDPRR
ncbi:MULTISPECIES: DUF3046 domain-containing protein [Microbacterium]|uniref:DUF3046 domain-containing protein n=1 Tax=Microbacterium aquilitoris TaxID=3067307 RepID=A0ABU3GI04_9MICO|nr:MULTISPECIES: DUF3046 domain-containing protein [unclassified Microbacterium]MDT3330326.1 DUF3046 domain-containing protein [Microbacterium sp. KSW-18]SDG79534.1 Protein of unknown function [Microbacterium sp. 77mftsu3.1]